jgi:hypothetical protein
MIQMTRHDMTSPWFCSGSPVLNGTQLALFISFRDSLWRHRYGYPLAMPVEGLITGYAFWVYFLLPASAYSIPAICHF